MSERVRAATAADVPLYTRLFAELGLDEPTPPPSRAAQLVPHMRVVELDGRAVGFTVAEREGDVGLLRQIVVDPVARGLGLGRRLCQAAADQLRAAGAHAMRLNVRDDNAPAIALYRSLGLDVLHRAGALWATHGVRLRLPASAAPLAVVDPPRSADAALEARFDVPGGQLAHFRARGDLVRAVRPAPRGEALGVMRLSPSFPGAYPFRARSLSVARSLLGEVERLIPTVPRFALMIEADDALVGALVAAGATLRFRLLVMSGPL